MAYPLPMTSTDRVRALALSLGGAVEAPHHGFPSFRAGGRIFATLPDPEHLHAMVAEEEVPGLVGAHAACEELWWGKRLAGVRVELGAAGEALVEALLLAAWERARRR